MANSRFAKNYDDGDWSSENSSDDGGTEPAHVTDSARTQGTEENVVLWRVVVVCLLALNMSIAGVTYLWSLITRDNHVQDQFHVFAERIAAKSLEQSKRLDGELRIIANHVQSVSVTNETSWPFYNQMNFQWISSDFLNDEGFQLVALTPLVTDDTRSAWESYSARNQQWVEDAMNVSLDFLEHNESIRLGIHDLADLQIQPNIYRRGHNGEPFIEYRPGPFVPLWQYSNASVNPSLVNFNLLSVPRFSRIFYEVMESRRGVRSHLLDISDLFGDAPPAETKQPISIFAQPIFRDYSSEADVVAAMVGVTPWHTIFEKILPFGVDGLVCVVQSTCESTFTYQIDGRTAFFLGEGDLHDYEFDYLDQTFDFNLFDDEHNHCNRTLRVFPSERFYDVYRSKTASLFTGFLILIFLATCAVFRIYEITTGSYERKLAQQSAHTNQILATLYPQEIREQVLQQAVPDVESKTWETDKSRLDNFLSRDDESGDITNLSKPIATLFPHCSVMYADMAGFTAWSSVRDPEAVFTLLETVYFSFDKIARRRGVFKVETIGDCYVAVTGLPKPQPDHAVIMTKFAKDCIRVMNESIAKLELSLGPGTGELAMRIGVHSGPVTAGVLRGEKSRFQLFGETVNLAARYENTGMRNRIHVSCETTALLIAAGKSSWVEPREEKVKVVGNDGIKTFWIVIKKEKSHTSQSTSSGSHEESNNEIKPKDPVTERGNKELDAQKEARAQSVKLERLIKWNVDLLTKLLTEVASDRDLVENPKTKEFNASSRSIKSSGSQESECGEFELDPTIIGQLAKYVEAIAMLHGKNPFHNFEHTSHVTMSTNRLLGRLTCSADSLGRNKYNTTIDPLTRFALVFSALNHDIGHRGINDYHRLVNDISSTGEPYSKQNVVEQNSFGLVWGLFMEDQFIELRKCICPKYNELRYFQQLLMNSSNATHISDAAQLRLHMKRWKEVFNDIGQRETYTLAVGTNGRAAVVTENLVLASYFSHTMQNWQVYKKWNDQFLEEMKLAHISGFCDEDPSIGWCERELEFFDKFIIPLAKNLSYCGGDGSSSNEFLDYAKTNRREMALLNQKALEQPSSGDKKNNIFRRSSTAAK